MAEETGVPRETQTFCMSLTEKHSKTSNIVVEENKVHKEKIVTEHFIM